MRIFWQTILMKYHALFVIFEKASKFEFVVCCKLLMVFYGLKNGLCKLPICGLYLSLCDHKTMLCEWILVINIGSQHKKTGINYMQTTKVHTSLHINVFVTAGKV